MKKQSILKQSEPNYKEINMQNLENLRSRRAILRFSSKTFVKGGYYITIKDDMTKTEIQTEMKAMDRKEQMLIRMTGG